jgi:hypothetical protein
MENTFHLKAADPHEPENTTVDKAPEPAVVSQSELLDRFRNFPGPQLQFRALIKSVPGLAA